MRCLVTWNIQWGRGADGRVDLERTAAVLRAFDADIFCLQEVAANHAGLAGGAAEDQIARLAALLPGYAPVYGAGSDLPDGAGGRRLFGNLILSRLPLLQVFRHALPWPADPQVPSMPRIAVEAVIEAPAGPMRVLTTHLEYYSAAQRLAQVDALRAVHAEGWRHARAPRSDAESDPPFAVLPRGEFTLLCGDFNCRPDAPELARLQAADESTGGAPRLIDAWGALHPDEAHSPTAGLHGAAWPAAPDCFDYVFVSENLVPRLRTIVVDGDIAASDHQPICLTFDMEKK